jgi:general stress protein YciG
MAGTILGGQKARDKNLAKDPEFYSKIGKKGGKNGHTGGFYANRELARIAGKKGGCTSRRRPAKAQGNLTAEDIAFPPLHVKQTLFSRLMTLFGRAR